MEVVDLQAFGAFAFLLATLVLGILIRRRPGKPVAERLSRISHMLFWGGLVLPECIGVVYPGLTSFDGLTGLPPLPFPGTLQILGWIVLIAGLYYLVVSNFALKANGSGYAAFKLTRRVFGPEHLSAGPKSHVFRDLSELSGHQLKCRVQLLGARHATDNRSRACVQFAVFRRA